MSTFGTRLLENLHEENQTITSLVKLIQNEQALLINADIEEIKPIVDQKAQHIAKLAELSNKRHLILATAGHQPDESGMQTWIDQNAAHTVDQAWQSLLNLVRTAKELNHTNGLLINTHLSRNQNTLNVLRGSNKTGNIYGPDGQTTSATKSRGIVVG
ncbi:flagella synthesis protein FlgN [Sulfuriferula thiophila]|uniref:flagella synthesis protein FlgN n=1 Tax=Sulfuriferula thiophila TaxID=1781211 RepID=UPI000F61536D|nr:flagellar protein FlgN [Sulfuriferula thiophila]